jgi:hypothetical protein
MTENIHHHTVWCLKWRDWRILLEHRSLYFMHIIQQLDSWRQRHGNCWSYELINACLLDNIRFYWNLWSDEIAEAELISLNIVLVVLQKLLPTQQVFRLHVELNFPWDYSGTHQRDSNFISSRWGNLQKAWHITHHDEYVNPWHAASSCILFNRTALYAPDLKNIINKNQQQHAKQKTLLNKLCWGECIGQ